MLAGVSGMEEAEEEMMPDVSDVKIEIDVAEDSLEPWLAAQPDPQGEQSRQTAEGFEWPFKTWQWLEKYRTACCLIWWKQNLFIRHNQKFNK